MIMKVNLTNTLCGAALYVMVLMASLPKQELVSPEEKMTTGGNDCSTTHEVDLVITDPISFGL